MPKVRFRPERKQNTAEATENPAKQPEQGSEHRRTKPLEKLKRGGLSREPTSEAPPSFAPASPPVQKSEWSKLIYFRLLKMSEQNKLVKMLTDSAVLVGLTAGVGYLAKKILKENFLGDPSSNVMNYAKFTGVLAGSMALKTYLEDQKILPKSI